MVVARGRRGGRNGALVFSGYGAAVLQEKKSSAGELCNNGTTLQTTAPYTEK